MKTDHLKENRANHGFTQPLPYRAMWIGLVIIFFVLDVYFLGAAEALGRLFAALTGFYLGRMHMAHMVETMTSRVKLYQNGTDVLKQQRDFYQNENHKLREENHQLRLQIGRDQN